MDLSYTVSRSEKRKKLTITVERDRTIVVHAPAHASDEAIKRIVQSKKALDLRKNQITSKVSGATLIPRQRAGER